MRGYLISPPWHHEDHHACLRSGRAVCQLEQTQRGCAGRSLRRVRLTMRAGYLMYRWKGDDIHSITPTSMPLRQTRTRHQHTPAAFSPTRPPAQDVGGSHLFSMREIVLMMELMMTHTVKRSMAMPGLAVRPLPLTYGNRPACPDLLPAGSAPATPLLFGRGGREGRRDGTAGTGGRRAGRDRHPRCRRYVQYCRASGAKCRGGDGRCHLRAAA